MFVMVSVVETIRISVMVFLFCFSAGMLNENSIGSLSTHCPETRNVNKLRKSGQNCINITHFLSPPRRTYSLNNTHDIYAV